MKKFKNESNFLVICGTCILVVLMICYFSFNVFFMELTTSFGGVTGSLAIPYNVTYSSNWPDSLISNETSVYSDKKQHIILDNMFKVPDGYEFVGWNTMEDGSGISYKVNDTMSLEDNVNLYAQWSVVNEPVIAYGDVNLNGVIDENDYLLIYNHILGNDVLDGQTLLNADVNNDGIINTIDVDIVEQAYKGTEGYTGYLPNSPIFIYELYDDSIDVGNGSNNGGNKPSDSSGSGSGTTGNGSGNSGNGTDNATSGNTGAGNKGQNSTSNDSNSSKLEDSDASKDDSKAKIYEFKFISDDKEYAITTCNVLDDGTCELVLPNVIPSKNGYTFNGWSLTKDCSNDTKLIAPIVVSESGTYYACFSLITDEAEDSNSSYTWVIVFTVWIAAITLIYRLVNYYKNENN